MSQSAYLNDMNRAAMVLYDHPVVAAAMALREAIRCRVPIYVCGNGGSASMADHFVIDMVKMAGATNIQSLSSNMAVITAWANDVSYADVFGAQLHGLDRRSVLVAISSSGRSENVLRAARIVRTVEEGMVIGISGRTGHEYNALLTLSTHPIAIPSNDTQIVEDVTGISLHLITKLIKEANNA